MPHAPPLSQELPSPELLSGHAATMNWTLFARGLRRGCDATATYCRRPLDTAGGTVATAEDRRTERGPIESEQLIN